MALLINDPETQQVVECPVTFTDPPAEDRPFIVMSHSERKTDWKAEGVPRGIITPSAESANRPLTARRDEEFFGFVCGKGFSRTFQSLHTPPFGFRVFCMPQMKSVGTCESLLSA